MAWLDRFRRNPGTVALTAAAEVIDKAAKDEGEAARKRREKWQGLSWDYYDQLPEVGFAVRMASNALSRCRIFPAIQPDPDSPPVPLEPGDPRYMRATMELNKLRSVDGSYSDLLRSMTTQLILPGECWLVGFVQDNGELEYGIYSIDEVKFKDERWWVDDPNTPAGTPRKLNLRTDEMKNGEQPVGPWDYLVRIYTPHPKKRLLADSPMRQIVDVCEELTFWELQFRAIVRSRVTAGLLLWPKDADLPTQEVPGQTPEQKAANDPLVKALLTAIVTPIQDPGSASAVAPPIVKMKGTEIEHVRLLEFARSVDPIAADRIEFLIKRIITGLPLPNELVTGVGDANHWTAFQIPEDAFNSHYAPTLVAECANLTSGFLRPHLADVPGGEDVIVWYDATPLIQHPNRDKDAGDALLVGAIGYEAYRRYRGFTEDDAPTDEDLALLERLKPRGMGGVTQGSPLPADGATMPAITAAATLPVSSVGARLAAIDRDLFARLQVAADAAAFRAMEKAGAKMRRKLGKGSEFTPMIADVANHDVCMVLGPDVVRSHFATTDELVDDAVAPIIGNYLTWTTAAQAKVRALLAATDPNYDEAAAAARQAEDREAGLGVLATGLAAAIAGALYSPTAEVTPGEANPANIVKPGVIRDALAAAGGKPGGVSVDPVTGDPAGGVGTGVTALDLFASIGLVPDSWTWIYGSSSVQFPPHFALDDVTFLDWSDEVLAVPEGFEWLDRSFLAPGDHLGCDCTFEPTMVESDALSSESIDAE